MAESHPHPEHLSEKQIKECIIKIRLRMIDCGLKYGLTHPYTVELSQILDTYINELQKR